MRRIQSRRPLDRAVRREAEIARRGRESSFRPFHPVLLHLDVIGGEIAKTDDDDGGWDALAGASDVEHAGLDIRSPIGAHAAPHAMRVSGAGSRGVP